MTLLSPFLPSRGIITMHVSILVSSCASLSVRYQMLDQAATQGQRHGFESEGTNF